MELAIALAVSVVFAFALKPAIKKAPLVFYALALIASCVFASHMLMAAAPAFARAIYPYMQRCLIAFGLFTIVMFIGVLPERNRIRRYLSPIRAELSIIAAFLSLGHIVNYLNAFMDKILKGFAGMSAPASASVVISIVVVALLIILTITSFNFVKAKMKPVTWKKVQRLAYVFYGLTCIHILLILAPTVSTDGGRALVSVAVYATVFLLYAALRAGRAVIDAKSRPISDSKSKA